MKLMLEVSSKTGNGIKTLVLQQEQATIGRRSDSTLFLEDAKRYISSQHAKIEYSSPDYFITDTSTNGLLLNNITKPIGKGNSVKLRDGDQLHIGEYNINVMLVAEQQSLQTPIEVEKDDFFSADPFAELDNEDQSNTENQTTSEHDFFDLDSEHAQHPLEVDPPPVFKEAFNPYAGEGKQQKPAETDNLFGDDWFSKGQDDHNTSNKVPLPKKHSLNSETADIQTSLIIENFLRGAGVEQSELNQSITAESFYTIGKILRASIQGTMDVLVGRAKIKNEMHLDVTMIKSKENNPVKFSVSAEEAMKKLLAPQDAGYLSAEEAIEEAFDDIRAHQFSVISGMQTALLDVLKRFDPKKLEHRFQQKNPISSSIPIHKQAKLWDAFEYLYNDIEREAADNFYRLFGQAFSESYEQQMLKLKKPKKNSPF